MLNKSLINKISNGYVWKWNVFFIHLYQQISTHKFDMKKVAIACAIFFLFMQPHKLI